MFKKSIFLFFVFSLFAYTAFSQSVDPYQPDPNPIKDISGYKYAWGDEFNTEGVGVNEDLWHFEEGFIRGNEKQYYQKDNATVTGGRLLITGRKEVVRNVNFDPSSGDYRKYTEYSEYTSSSLLGKRKRLFLFGRIEVRAKIDASNGSFPAIWTCGFNKDWPQNGEIDIMEYYYTGGNPVLTSNFCVGGDQNGSDGYWAQKWQSVFTQRSYYEAKDADWMNKYHVFRMDWTTDSLKLYVDDELRNSLKISDFKNWDGSIAFHNPQFMMLNLAIKDFGHGIAENLKFEVDYFRVYQKTIDTEKPTKVTGLQVSDVAATSFRLSWNKSTDNKGIYRYDVYKNGIADGYFINSSTDTTLFVTGMNPSTTYKIYVNALDSVGNYSDTSEPLTVTTAMTVTATDGEIYNIINYNSGKALCPTGGLSSSGAAMVQLTINDSNTQKWLFTDLGTGYWTIKNVANGLFLDIAGSSVDNGAKNIQAAYTGGNSQQWQLVKSGNNYNIVNRNSGKYLDISSASQADNASCIQWGANGGNNQLWELVLTTENNDPTTTPTYYTNEIIAGDYFIIKKNTDQYWTNTNVGEIGGTPALQSLAGTTDILAQVWTISLDNGYYKIVNKADGRYINEKGNFGTNEYSSEWNTYNIYSNDNLDCAIQITQFAATGSEWSSGASYLWKWNTSNVIELNKSHANFTGEDDFIFTLIPYSTSGIKNDTFDSLNYWITPQSLNICTDKTLFVSVYNMLGVLVKSEKIDSNTTIPLSKGIHIVKFQQSNIDKTIKVLIK